MALVTTWRGGFSNREVDDLEAVMIGRPALIEERNWIRILDTYALGWVCVRDESAALIGFAHVGPPLTPGEATLLQPLVHPRFDRDVLVPAMAAACARATGLEVRLPGPRRRRT